MKVFETVKNGQAQTQVSTKSLESQSDSEQLEGVFSAPLITTQGMDRAQLARSPKDTDKGAFEGQKTQSSRFLKSPEDDFVKPYIED